MRAFFFRYSFLLARSSTCLSTSSTPSGGVIPSDSGVPCPYQQPPQGGQYRKNLTDEEAGGGSAAAATKRPAHQSPLACWAAVVQRGPRLVAARWAAHRSALARRSRGTGARRGWAKRGLTRAPSARRAATLLRTLGRRCAVRWLGSDPEEFRACAKASRLAELCQTCGQLARALRLCRWRRGSWGLV